MYSLISCLCSLTILISFSKETATKFVLHKTLTNGCITLKDKYDVVLNGTTDVEAPIFGPRGTKKAVLPIDINTAEELARLQILDPDAETVVIMHGYTDDGVSGFALEMTEGYLKLGSYNIISLDGKKVTNLPYLEVFKVVKIYEVLGDLTAEFLAHLHNRKVIKASKIHMIGMSFGAQMASRTGKTFEKLTGVKLGRITGLDPVGPCYEYTDTNLSKNDAEYVDIIHTNAGIGGTIASRGHIDFIVNGGGPGQVGCPMPLELGCNHKRACVLYIESLNQNYEPFYARKCSSYANFVIGLCNNIDDIAIMGYKADPSITGIFHLRTKSESPLSLGMEGTKSPGLLKTIFGN